jgi:branched-chain amino acid transport system ATP-binding protein
MLSVEGLNVSYGKVQALRDVSLEVAEGELVGVVGPNGAGKSTLLLAIAGGLNGVSGEIALDGERLRGRRPEQIATSGVALVPEGRHIFHSLTVAENLKLGATANGGKPDDELLERTLDRFSVLRRCYATYAGKLSGGEQQQLAIARALLGRPRILMLDEPSLGLAPIVIDSVFESLAELRATGVTILLVEQLAARTVKVADRSYVLRNGRVALSGTRSELEGSEAVEAAFFGFEEEAR